MTVTPRTRLSVLLTRHPLTEAVFLEWSIDIDKVNEDWSVVDLCDAHELAMGLLLSALQEAVERNDDGLGDFDDALDDGEHYGTGVASGARDDEEDLTEDDEGEDEDEEGEGPFSHELDTRELPDL